MHQPRGQHPDDLRRAAQDLVAFLEQDGQLPAPRQLTRRHVEAYVAHLIDTRSAAAANVVYRALQQLMRWLLHREKAPNGAVR